jgi:molecular chaperone GrpE (heat shock protein)
MDFKAELDKLLARETGSFPENEGAGLAAADRELLAELNKKQDDTSLQIEEIYDLVKEQGLLRETLGAEKTRADRLAMAAMGLSDLLEDFYAYAGQSDSGELRHQAQLLWEKAGGLLSGCGIVRFGEAGEPLNPRMHRVEASAESTFPREQIIRVLQSGYLYQNALIRKTAVVVSRGQDNGSTEYDRDGRDTAPTEGGQGDEQNRWH